MIENRSLQSTVHPSSKSPIGLDPREGPPWGPEQGSSQESRESQSKIPSIAILEFRPSRPEIFENRSSIHRNPMLSRFTETAAERVPSARCNALNRCCAVPQQRHFLSNHRDRAKLLGNVPFWKIKFAFECPFRHHSFFGSIRNAPSSAIKT